MDEVFTQKKWERFLSISAAQWEVLLDSLPALLTEEEKTGFLQRINHVKQAVFRQIEKNKSHLLPVIDMAGEQGKNIRALLGEYGLSLPSDIAFLPKSALGELETLHRRFQRLSSVVPPNSPASSSNSSRQAHPRSRRAQWLTACLPCIPPRGADPSASPPPSKISVHLRERHVSFGETWKRQALIATAMGMSEVLRKYSIRPDAGNSDEKSADAAV